LGQLRQEPLPQNAVRRIANAQPHDYWRLAALPGALSKVFIFGNQDGLVFQSVTPNG
jgi:hypothetical protein